MSLIDDLTDLVPPPANPVCSTGDWQDVEQSLGVKLPSDYKHYIERYGYGDLCSFFTIESPFCLPGDVREHWLDLADYYEDWSGGVREVPYPLYPAHPGLLPCGRYGDVDVLNWYTSGDPDDWPIVYCDRADGFFLVKGTGLVSFILQVLQGNSPIPEPMMSKAILNQPFVFRPYRSKLGSS